MTARRRSGRQKLTKRLHRLERRQDQLTREVLNAVARILEEYLPEYEVEVGSWALPRRAKKRRR